MLKKFTGYLVLLIALGAATATQAQIVLSFSYDGLTSRTTVTMSGTLTQFTAASIAHDITSFGSSIKSDGLQGVGSNGLTDLGATSENIHTGSLPWSAISGSTVPTSYTGSTVGLYSTGSNIFMPTGFTAGDSLSGTWVFDNKSLVDLGFASNSTGSGQVSGGINYADWSTSVSNVPEPSTYAACLGIFALGFVAFTRRRLKGSS